MRRSPSLCAQASIVGVDLLFGKLWCCRRVFIREPAGNLRVVIFVGPHHRCSRGTRSSGSRGRPVDNVKNRPHHHHHHHRHHHKQRRGRRRKTQGAQYKKAPIPLKKSKIVLEKIRAEGTGFAGWFSLHVVFVSAVPYCTQKNESYHIPYIAFGCGL